MTASAVLAALTHAAEEAAVHGRTLERAELPVEAYVAGLRGGFVSHGDKPVAMLPAGPVRLIPVSKLYSYVVAFDTTGEPWPAQIGDQPEFGDET